MRVNVGHAVKNGRIRYLSVSQVVNFDPTQVGGCNRKWAFDKVFGIKLPPTGQQAAGVEYARKLEHYLRTGEDVLPPVLQAAKRFFPAPGKDLELEQPLSPRFTEAVQSRDALISAQGDSERITLMQKIAEASGLCAAGIPFDGAADFRHRRGEYVDADGSVRPEHPGAVVCEIGDLKTTSQIDSRTTKSGTVLRGYAKTVAQVCEHPQMVGYGRHAIGKFPDLTHVRLSHVYAQTSAHGGAKRTGIIAVDEVLRRWDRIEGVARKMEQVATATRIEDVEPALASCDAYNYVDENGKTQKGCGYRTRCPLSAAQSFSVTLPVKEGKVMSSLFDQVPVAPEVPALPSAADATQAPPPPVEASSQVKSPTLRQIFKDVSGEVMASACVVDKEYLVDCEDGRPPQRMKFEGASKKGPSGGEVFIFVAADGSRARLDPGEKVIAIAQVHGVVPPDAPAHDPATSAAPPSSAAIAEITDPSLKAKVEAHAAAHAERVAAEAATQSPTKTAVGRCSGGGQTVAFTMAQAMKRKVACPTCGVIRSIPKDVVERGETSMVFPGHNIVASSQNSYSPAPPVPPLPPTDTARQTTMDAVVPPPPPPVESDYERGFRAGVAKVRGDLVKLSESLG